MKSNPLKTDVNFSFKMVDPEGKFRIASQMVSVDIVKDFVNSKTDQILVTFHMGMGTFVKWVHPRRNTLTGVLKGRGPDVGVFMSGSYHCVIVNNEGNIDSTQYDNATEEELNQAQLVTVKAALILNEFLGLRSVYTSGVYHNTNVQTLVTGLWKNSSKNVRVQGKQISLEVEMTESVNKTIYPEILLPADTLLMDLTKTMQNGSYGIYNSTICEYITYRDSQLYCFITPLFDPTLFDKAKRRLVVKKSNNPQYNLVEDSWEADSDGNLTILANTNTQFKDNGDTDSKLSPSGVIRSDPATTFLYSDSTIEKDKCRVDGGNHSAGFKDANKHTLPNAKVCLSAENMYKERESMIRNNMQIITIQWNFAHPNMITPGMPVVFVYKAHGKTEQRKGTVIFTQYLWKKTDMNIAGTVVIAVEKTSKVS